MALMKELAAFAALGVLPVGIDIPAPPVPVIGRPVGPLIAPDDTVTVELAPLLERHLTRTDGFVVAGEATLVSGTLDLAGDGFLAVTAPGDLPRFFKIQRGMAGGWRSGGRRYSVSLSVNIFRARLNNVIVIRDDADRVVWQKTIRELFRLTYAAGEPVTLAGRPYRLFYARQPDGSAREGLCFIYDENRGGTHEYHFYMVPREQVEGAFPTSYRMYGGDLIRLRLDPDGPRLHIAR